VRANGPYSADVILRASFGVAGDEDVFAVRNTSTTASMTVRFETYSGDEFGNCDSSHDTVINLRNALGTLLDQDDDDGISLCSLLDYVIPPSTTIYVHMVEYGDNTASNYFLKVDFL